MNRILLLILSIISLCPLAKTQTCTGPTHTPVTPILICNASTLFMNPAPQCGQTNIPGACSDAFNQSPHYFRMNCFSSGSLGFIITPSDASANYNWQLFDITNTNPFDIFTNGGLYVASNWSPTQGDTGASPDGINTTECGGSDRPFSSMPNIVAGRTYLLMISDRSTNGSGYQLSFTGGSAVIIDPVQPQISDVTANCDATKLLVTLNKAIRCFSIASDGSDFSLNTGANITGASPLACNPQGVTGSIILTLDQPLPNGNYILTVNSGSDGNTLIDYCNAGIAAGETFGVTVSPPQPTLLDSIKPVACTPGIIELVFKRALQCSSIAADGSDFLITGPQAVTHTITPIGCSIAGTSSVFQLHLSSPLLSGGTYTVQLRNGTDGNTLIDECGNLSPPGTKTFNVLQSASAIFNYSVSSSCQTDTVYFSHNGANGVNSWNWRIDNSAPITEQNPVRIYTDSGTHVVRLIVSNGSCSDTTQQTIRLPGRVKAAFKAPVGVCPGESIILENKSSGNINNWQWNLGSGMNSSLYNPHPYQYPVPTTSTAYQVLLIVTNSVNGCRDTARHTIVAVDECRLMVPTAFSPNNDGLNDYVRLLNASKASKVDFRIYNRMGQLVFLTNNTHGQWDGTYKGMPLDPGMFVWMLSYTSTDTGKRIFMKGTTMLLR